MASKVIGKVVHVEGSVQIRGVDGVIRILNIGDSVREGELLITSINSEIEIMFFTGRAFKLDEIAEVLLDESMYRLLEFHDGQVIGDVDTLGLGIGVDTTDLADLDSTAAGPEQDTDGLDTDNTVDTPIYERDGREGEVDVQPTPFNAPRRAAEDDEEFIPEEVLVDSAVPPTAPGSPVYITLGDIIAVEGGSATIDATVGTPVAGSNLVITLDNGATITITVGNTTGTSTSFTVANTEDPYVDAGSYTVGISGTSGGNFTALDTTDTALVSVGDTTDITTLTLNDVNVNEGAGTATISASLDNAPTDAPLV
ncbi:MAG: hypothetical protein OQL16_12065, partial [Gammaproteobacteria bacterium]|nr:hypothetical protein [Gammaproteobacteria bacterium]